MNGVQVARAQLGPLHVPPERSSLGWFATIKPKKKKACRGGVGGTALGRVVEHGAHRHSGVPPNPQTPAFRGPPPERHQKCRKKAEARDCFVTAVRRQTTKGERTTQPACVHCVRDDTTCVADDVDESSGGHGVVSQSRHGRRQSASLSSTVMNWSVSGSVRRGFFWGELSGVSLNHLSVVFTRTPVVS